MQRNTQVTHSSITNSTSGIFLNTMRRSDQPKAVPAEGAPRGARTSSFVPYLHHNTPCTGPSNLSVPCLYAIPNRYLCPGSKYLRNSSPLKSGARGLKVKPSLGSLRFQHTTGSNG